MYYKIKNINSHRYSEKENTYRVTSLLCKVVHFKRLLKVIVQRYRNSFECLTISLPTKHRMLAILLRFRCFRSKIRNGANESGDCNDFIEIRAASEQEDDWTSGVASGRIFTRRQGRNLAERVQKNLGMKGTDIQFICFTPFKYFWFC